MDSVEDMKGLIPLEVTIGKEKEYGEEYDVMAFRFDHGVAKLRHHQDCCESVWIEDVNGDLEDLVGTQLLISEKSVSNHNSRDGDFSETWTFYRFASFNGFVDVRWCGRSNGYYSESVNFEWTENESEQTTETH